jgi:phospho-N-acetylmuramoyl-pentapeptide-transferase
MLYELSMLLDFNLFGYISIRAGIAFFISFGLTFLLMPKYLAWATAKKANQPISKFVAKHENKQHTPSMGGAVFLTTTLVGVLFVADMSNPYIIAGLISLLGFGYIGFLDDYNKIAKKDNLGGLTPRGKMALQILFSITPIAIILFVGFPTTFYIPFFKTPLFDLGYFMVLFWIFLFVATSNAVNITDGLDGLATVPSIIALTSLGAIVYVTGHAIFAEYLLIPNIKGVGEVVIIAAALSGGLLGFLWYNCYPAEIFMGDTGSLAIGGFLAYMAILGKSEVLLALIGIIFVIETVSVILQVGSFKLREKRIFMMAPIHHHFELKGWAENKIIVRFWMIAFLANIIALISFKVR